MLNLYYAFIFLEMSYMHRFFSSFSRHSTVFTMSILLCSLSPSSLLAGEGDLYQNLEPIEGAKAALAEIDPNADFSVYKRIKILDAYVAFRSGWERDQVRTGSRMRISNSEVERIKGGVADLFKEVLAETLQKDDGYEIVDETGADVLLIRPAIIDLDINAPDTMAPGRTQVYTAETGAATLYIELFDSMSSQIIGRAADRQTIRNAGDIITWSNRATNTGDAKRLFGKWSQALRDFLDAHYSD